MRVLCPLDGSERSTQAMARGLAMFPKGTEATLFCVQSGGFAKDDRAEAFDDDEGDEIFPTKDSCQRMLDAAMELVPKGIKADTHVGTGKTTAAILEQAADYDVLLMHRMDPSGFKEKLRMSSTERLTRQAPCSVLLVDD